MGKKRKAGENRCGEKESDSLTSSQSRVLTVPLQDMSAVLVVWLYAMATSAPLAVPLTSFDPEMAFVNSVACMRHSLLGH